MDLTAELEQKAHDNADDPQVLLEVLYDLTTWSDDELASLQRWIIEQISGNLDSTVTRTPTDVPTGDGNVDTSEWPRVGLLGSLGYKVGMSGKPRFRRRAILRAALQRDAGDFLSSDQAKMWGAPRSAKRLQKMVNSLAAFARNARKRSDTSLERAIEHWEEDISFLRSEYYDEFREVEWPETGRNESPDSEGHDDSAMTGDLFS